MFGLECLLALESPLFVESKNRSWSFMQLQCSMPGDGLAGVVDGNDGDIEILRYTTSGEIPIFSDIVLISPSGFFQYLILLKTVKNIRKYVKRAFRTDLCRS